MRFLIWNYFPYRTAWRLERFSGLAGQNISHRPLTPISGFPQSRRILKTIAPMISAHDHILSATVSPVLCTTFRIRGISKIPPCSVYTEAYIKDNYTCYLSTRGVFRPRQTRQLPRAVDSKGWLLSCQSY